MTTFDKRERQEEAKYEHDLEMRFKARAMRNKLLGLWVADKLGLAGDEAAEYAKNLVLLDFEKSLDDSVVDKVAADLEAKSVDISDYLLRKHLDQCESEALQQLKAESLVDEGSALLDFADVMLSGASLVPGLGSVCSVLKGGVGAARKVHALAEDALEMTESMFELGRHLITDQPAAAGDEDGGRDEG